MFDGYVFAFSLVDCLIMLSLAVYFMIALSDLECDYINSRTCCERLNKMVLPEIIGMAVASLLHLICFHWLHLLFLVPMTIWNLHRYLDVPSGNLGVFDPIEIHDRNVLNSFIKGTLAKIGFHLLWFFVSLYHFILFLVG